MSNYTEKVSIVCILHNDQRLIPLIKANLENFDYPEELLEYIILDYGIENNIEHFIENDKYNYIYLNHQDIIKYLDKITFKNDDENIIKIYYTITGKLPNGFLRDYVVGMTSNDYIFHMDSDMSYDSKSIKKKLDFLKKNRVHSVYSDKLLCIDSNNNLYKTQSPYKVYEGTMFHTKEFWNQNKFDWGTLHSEGRMFHASGLHKLRENYYDNVKILSVKNFSQYKCVNVDKQKSTFDYCVHECTHNISYNDYNPIKETIKLLFNSQTGLSPNILGYCANSITTFNETQWNIYDYDNNKCKQNKLVSSIKNKFNDTVFDVLVYGHNQVVWDLFEKIEFKQIIIETHKNLDQLKHIIEKCKNYNYIFIENSFLNKKFFMIPEQTTEQTTE